MWNIPEWGVLWEVSSTHQRACGRHFGAGTFPDTPSDAPTRKSLGSSQIKSQVAISPGPESQQEWADPAISPLQAFLGFMVLNCPHLNLLPLSAPQREKWEESSHQVPWSQVTQVQAGLRAQVQLLEEENPSIRQGSAPGSFLLRLTQLQ